MCDLYRVGNEVSRKSSSVQSLEVPPESALGEDEILALCSMVEGNFSVGGGSAGSSLEAALKKAPRSDDGIQHRLQYQVR